MNKNIDILYLARNHNKIDQSRLHIENELETNKTFVWGSVRIISEPSI